jgi:4-amino-4-deoxy-L-arabinose transferase-like glycosyltransferase
MLTSPNSVKNDSTATWWVDIFLLVLFFGILYFWMLGERPLFVPDEGRYAEIAREMSLNNDFVTPYLNSIKYFEKPPLFYWLSAAAVKTMGLSVWSIRCVNALIALLGCIATYLAGRKLYGRRAGLMSAVVLGTSTLYFVMAHMISLDLPVTVFLACCFYAFIVAVEYPPGKTRRWLIWLAAIAAALAVLTKGLIGLVFPAMIMGSWMMLTKQWRLLTRLYLPSALVIFLLIAAPWHILVTQRNPEFFYFYFIEQHILRYTSMEVGHYQPVWFFIPVFMAAFFPWIVLLPSMFWRLKPKKTEWYFVLWAALIFIFFSFSKSKLIPYILPTIPPLAILMGRYIALGRDSVLTLVSSALATGAFLLALLFVAPMFDTRTIFPLTEILKSKLTPTADVITYNQYYQDLPFYLQRRVSILNWKNELTYGMAHQDTREWMINDGQFWQRWHSKQSVYVFISDEELAKLQKRHPHDTFHLLGQVGSNCLIGNK